MRSETNVMRFGEMPSRTESAVIGFERRRRTRTEKKPSLERLARVNFNRRSARGVRVGIASSLPREGFRQGASSIETGVTAIALRTKSKRMRSRSGIDANLASLPCAKASRISER